jgi:pyruvate/2-oxoglutarate dehydrogenase complex dihydrolipoamide dehydrogenase (E3) component
MKFDILIIGSGPGGYVAAIREGSTRSRLLFNEFAVLVRARHL